MKITPLIIFENDSYFVIDKPSGWITNDASTTKDQPVVQTWVREQFEYPLKNNYLMRDGVVHRLDKETSGILLVAKTEAAFTELQRQFKERIVKKRYTALAHGKVLPENGEVRVAVGRLPWRKDRFGVIPGGRESKTLYETLDHYKDAKDVYSLLLLKPETGRTHQIRIHLKHINHPIVSDTFYAGRKTSRKDRKWCPRLFLHASEINFIDPITQKEVHFKSALAQDLQKALDILEKL